MAGRKKSDSLFSFEGGKIRAKAAKQIRFKVELLADIWGLATPSRYMFKVGDMTDFTEGSELDKDFMEGMPKMSDVVKAINGGEKVRPASVKKKTMETGALHFIAATPDGFEQADLQKAIRNNSLHGNKWHSTKDCVEKGVVFSDIFGVLDTVGSVKADKPYCETMAGCPVAGMEITPTDGRPFTAKDFPSAKVPTCPTAANNAAAAKLIYDTIIPAVDELNKYAITLDTVRAQEIFYTLYRGVADLVRVHDKSHPLRRYSLPQNMSEADLREKLSDLTRAITDMIHAPSTANFDRDFFSSFKLAEETKQTLSEYLAAGETATAEQKFQVAKVANAFVKAIELLDGDDEIKQAFDLAKQRGKYGKAQFFEQICDETFYNKFQYDPDGGLKFYITAKVITLFDRVRKHQQDEALKLVQNGTALEDVPFFTTLAEWRKSGVKAVVVDFQQPFSQKFRHAIERDKFDPGSRALLVDMSYFMGLIHMPESRDEYRDYSQKAKKIGKLLTSISRDTGIILWRDHGALNMSAGKRPFDFTVSIKKNGGGFFLFGCLAGLVQDIGLGAGAFIPPERRISYDAVHVEVLDEVMQMTTDTREANEVFRILQMIVFNHARNTREFPLKELGLLYHESSRGDIVSKRRAIITEAYRRHGITVTMTDGPDGVLQLAETAELKLIQSDQRKRHPKD